MILIRGLPGSGKSTLAKNLATELNMIHVETDMFFERDGVFDGRKLDAAHKWCQNRVESLIKRRYKVVVSNTFSCLWEMRPYLYIASKYRRPVRVIKCIGTFKSIHNVPASTIENMRLRWQDYPGESVATLEASLNSG